MNNLLVATAVLWGTILALPAAAQAQDTPAQTTAATPGETVFLSTRLWDNGYLDATFDTDSRPVGGLSPAELNRKFHRVTSLARILNFMKQNGYRVVSFVPTPAALIDGYGGELRGLLFVFEYSKPQ